MRRHSKPVFFSALSVLALLTASATQAFTPSVVDLGLLKPHDTWKVGTVSAGAGAYCVMVNQFDKKATLAFARNPEGYGSLAIDFRERFFNSGEDYGIALQADDGKMHKFIARASSERSVIVQIGVDDGFYNSLNGDGNLKVRLPMTDAVFRLSAFSGSFMQLVNCAVNLQQQGPKTAAMPVPGVEKAALNATGGLTAQEQRISAAEQFKIDLGEEKSEETPILRSAELKKERDAMQALAEDARAIEENYQMKAELAVTRAKLAAALSDQARLKSKLTESTLAHPDRKLTGDLAAAREFEAELGTLIINLKQQKEQLAINLTAQEKQNKILQASLEAKEQELASAKAVSGRESDTLAAARADLAGMTLAHVTEVENLHAQLREKDTQIEKRLADAGSMHKSATVYTSRLETELEQSERDMAELKTQLSYMEKQKSGLMARLDGQDRQTKVLISRLQEELDQSRQQLAMLEGQMMSVALQKDDLMAQLDGQSRQNNVLQAALATQQQATGPIALNGPPVSAAQTAGIAQKFASIAPAAGYAKKVSGRKGGFLPSVANNTLRRGAHGVPLRLNIPASAGRGYSGAASDDWETIVVQ